MLARCSLYSRCWDAHLLFYKFVVTTFFLKSDIYERFIMRPKGHENQLIQRDRHVTGMWCARFNGPFLPRAHTSNVSQPGALKRGRNVESSLCVCPGEGTRCASWFWSPFPQRIDTNGNAVASTHRCSSGGKSQASSYFGDLSSLKGRLWFFWKWGCHLLVFRI